MWDLFAAPDGCPAVQPHHRAGLRAWLGEHHEASSGAWLVLPKKSAGRSMDNGEAVEELLCFGWIDSRVLDTAEQAERGENTNRWRPKG